MVKKIYIAGPLFSHAEREFNQKIDKFLNKLGFDTFLPQRDGYTLNHLLTQGLSEKEASDMIFTKDVDAIKRCDIIVFIMDGRVPDEGACVEIGIAYALDKDCVGFKSDVRSLIDGVDNPLIVGALKGRIARSSGELETYLKEYVP